MNSLRRSMNHWRALLVIYRQINVVLSTPSSHLEVSQALTDLEVGDAVRSFHNFPVLVEQLTEGLARVRHEVVEASSPLESLTPMGDGLYWPSPDDTPLELLKHIGDGAYDSVFILWPQTNFQTGVSIKSGGWGMGMIASAWSFGATYATVGNADSWVWDIPVKGEVWLHEWLHGVCPQFAGLGYEIPEGDADGGARHGYVQSPETGWTSFYRDLMTGKVSEDGRLKGIPLRAWSDPRPLTD
jgi:hypothetical protein